MERIPINRIIEASTVDGPGLRTAVFVQKCNIHCLYCHNPETQNLCVSCGKCVSHCPAHALTLVQGKVCYDKEHCIGCDTCISICEHHASPKIEYLSAEEVYQRIHKNGSFLSGITVSGGECTLYPKFLKELFTLAHKDGLSCLLDSNGMIPLEDYPFLMDVCDGVMLDIKSWERDIYHRLTGFDNDVVKSNLSYLDRIGKITELRIVYVPRLVDMKTCLLGIRDIVAESHRKGLPLILIRFRNQGVKGILKNHQSPTVEEMENIRAFAESLGFENIVIR